MNATMLIIISAGTLICFLLWYFSKIDAKLHLILQEVQKIQDSKSEMKDLEARIALLEGKNIPVVAAKRGRKKAVQP